MKICIWGLTGSGKTRLGDELSKALSIDHVGPTYKSSAGNDAGLIKMLGKVTPKYIKDFDKGIVRQSRGRDCVITTWHAPWVVKDATLRVWLNVGEAERAKRISISKKESIRYATRYVREKDARSLAQYKRAYGREMDYSVFDMKLNYERVTIPEAVSIISMVARSRDGQ